MAALTIIVLIFILLLYHFRTSIYNQVMGFEYRPLLPRDFVELSANIKQVQNMFEQSCHNQRYLDQLNQIDQRASSRFFGLVKDLEKEKINLLIIQRDFIDQTKVCKDDAYKPPIYPVSILTEDNKKIKIDLTNSDWENEFVIIENLGSETVKPRLVVNGKDWSSIQTILNSIIKKNMTDQQKAIAIWQFVVDARDHFAKPLSFSHRIEPLSLFNVWGYSNCGETARAVIALAEAAGFKAREVRLKGHIVAEVFYEEEWHMIDADAEVLYYDKEKNLHSVSDIERDPSIKNQMNTSVYGPEYMQKAYDGTRDSKIFKPSFTNSNFSFTLRPGESVVFNRGNSGKFFSGENYTLPPEFSNGEFILKRGVSKNEVIKFNYPYPIVGAKIKGDDEDIKFSNDGWRWKDIGSEDFSNLFHNGHGLPDYQYYLQFGNPGQKIIVTTVQMAPRSLPFLEENNSNTIEYIDNLGKAGALVNITFGLQRMSE